MGDRYGAPVCTVDVAAGAHGSRIVGDFVHILVAELVKNGTFQPTDTLVVAVSRLGAGSPL